MPDPDQCYWTEDEEVGMILIPQCWGCVINGPAACTCVREESWRQKFEAACRRIETAERYAKWARLQLSENGLREFPLVGEIKGKV